MSTILRITLDEYDRMIECGAFNEMDRRIELIRGELREMSPIGPFHVDLVNYLTRWSVESTSRDAVVVSVQNPINLPDQESRPQPDLLWLLPARKRRELPSAGVTLLAIEVADSSFKWDLNVKGALYAEAQIVEYWIVDASGECVHVFRSPTNGQYTDHQVFHREATISPLAEPNAKLVLNELFAEE